MASRCTAAALSCALAFAGTSAIAADSVPLAAHKAVYDLTLDKIRSDDVAGARGTMTYEMDDSCDGWATQQKLDMHLTNRDGQDINMVTDYATWESKDGLKMRFHLRQTTDTAVTEQVDGDAALDGPGKGGVIHYTMPKPQDMPLPAGTLFPTAHTAAILAGAEDGKKFLNIPIFDGTGDKGAQNSSVLILNWNGPSAAPDPALAKLSSGRVRIAFFKSAGGDQSPDYEVGMRYWANGVADDLNMDFGDFVMNGKLGQFELRPSHC